MRDALNGPEISPEPKRFENYGGLASDTHNPPKIMNTRKLIVVACGFALCAVPASFAGKDGAKHDKHFAAMDADGNGKITKAEHHAMAQKMFSECDANRDGTVTAVEMDAAMAKKGESYDKTEKSSAEKIAVIDQNGDGQLTQAEHAAGTDKMFAQSDTDGDGTLSKEECKAAMKQMKRST